MKLRHKKTGKVIDPAIYIFKSYDDGVRYGHCTYYSIAELNEEWEDYSPAEPLIKDEKIRKIVRAWYDNFRDERIDDKITFYHEKVGSLFRIDVLYDHDLQGCAELNLLFDSSQLKDGKEYTIAELCGEEE